MHPATRPKLTAIEDSRRPAATRDTAARLKVLASPAGSALAEFEQVYRRNVDVVMAYFARRCAEPQVVADLTSETFVRAAAGYATFDPGRGSPRAWLFGIAANVYAGHCAHVAGGRDAAARLAGRRALETDEIEELAGRIDAERSGRELIERWSQLPGLERAAIELVDLAGLTPKEASVALGVSRAALRKRLSRARGRLRKERHSDE
jgi:RNA polymerase sigma factor (sigma-70 family)